jgi:aminoglycoside phosphotransferase (APT) family kinase protein
MAGPRTGPDAVGVDAAILGRYLADRDVCGSEITVRPIGDGHSNLTYLVSDGTRTVVVRRPPPPPLPRGANDVLREARIIAALAGSRVPVPTVLATAEAGEVFDVPFFVMTYVPGPVFTTRTHYAPGDADSRRSLAESLVDVLAALHDVDWRAAGIRGHPEGATLRQHHRLASLIADDSGCPPARFRDLDAWLIANAPLERGAAPHGAALVHNDYRLGNLIAQDPPRRTVTSVQSRAETRDTTHGSVGRGARSARGVGVAAVLDWELAAVGDPLVDLGYLIASWAEPGGQWTPIEELGSASAEPGFPSRAELAARYAAITGRDLSALPWYVALAYWKLGVLYEYNRRKTLRGEGDPYYAGEDKVEAFLAAADRVRAGYHP